MDFSFDFSNSKTKVNAATLPHVQRTFAMEGSQFLESVGSEEQELSLADNERNGIRALLRCNEAWADVCPEDFPDEQDPDDVPDAPATPRKVAHGSRSRPIRLDLDDDVGVAPRRTTGGKEPARRPKRERSPPEEDTPDIVDYLSTTYGMSERDIAELCRATSTYLGKKDPRNRARWSGKSSTNGTWKKRGYGQDE